MPAKPPTARQLFYLRTLATQRGQTFTYPPTRAEASREIKRLKARRPDTHADKRASARTSPTPSRPVRPTTPPGVRSHEVHGYGSTATWTQNRDQEPASVEDRGPSPERRRPSVGERTELGSYTAGGQRRIIIGQRVDGVVRVCDIPDGPGGAYPSERELETKAELDALVADYLQRTGRLG